MDPLPCLSLFGGSQCPYTQVIQKWEGVCVTIFRVPVSLKNFVEINGQWLAPKKTNSRISGTVKRCCGGKASPASLELHEINQLSYLGYKTLPPACSTEEAVN